MATFYPSIEIIKKLKVPPTEGEWTLLNFLGRVLDDSYEVYFNPYLNGDRPDVIIMREGNGVMVIEVKDWNLDDYTLSDKKKWVFTPNGSVVKSPIDQVLKYKNNLFDLHVDKLLEMKINNIKYFNIVTCSVYFHCASQQKVDNLLVIPYKADKKYQDFLKYNVDLFGYDSLERVKFYNVLERRYLSPNRSSYYFTDELYKNFRRVLAPSTHFKNQVVPYQYSEEQKSVIYSENLEQRVRGVFGSGKTTVLAARAVQAYKRAKKWTVKPHILILTYNITLKNFIHDKLNMVDEDFEWESFTIINYHHFIKAELNNLGIRIIPPPEDLNDAALISKYFEDKYFSNVKLFDDLKSQIRKYDAVLIDEIQDYKRPWMDIIKNYFREPQGDYVLFGDVKQNIYNLPIAQKDVVTNVRGVKELKRCYRSEFKVRDLAQSFQKSVFGDKYSVDNFDEDGAWNFFGIKEKKEGYVNYMYLSESNTIQTLYNIVRGNILNKENNVSPNDITILGHTIHLLRLFDCYYRYASREKTNSMMEVVEVMYKKHLDKLKNDDNPWYADIFAKITRKLFPQKDYLSINEIVKIHKRLAILFTVYDLFSMYQDVFINYLKGACDACGLTIDTFFDFQKYYEQELLVFKRTVYLDDYKDIRDNKKIQFWMNSGTIKISTINSFKGWESDVVFLIIEPKYNMETDYNISFDELLYTGLTRCKRDLVIINFGNTEYDKKMRPLIERFK